MTPFEQACIWVGGFLAPWSFIVWFMATGGGAV